MLRKISKRRSFVETVPYKAINYFSNVWREFCVSSMKRTRAASKDKTTNKDESPEIAGISRDESEKGPKNTRNHITQRKDLQNITSRETLYMIENKNGMSSNIDSTIERSLANDGKSETKPKAKLNLKSLKDRGVKINEELKGKKSVVRGKNRAVVDLEMMKEELKQLEDPPLTPLEIEMSSARLQFSFFDTPCQELAQNLLGKVLARRLENGAILKGRIVETEGYLGIIDKASHTYQNRVTPKNLPMYMPPGTIYVYMTYGMYHCFNISSQGSGCAVLIRAVDPLEGIEDMANGRSSRATSSASKKSSKTLKTHELCNGPSKLCMAFQLRRCHSKYSMCSWKEMWLENDPTNEEFRIIKCPRIGIDSAGPEWAGKPLRYYIHGNTSVSKRDKKSEEQFGTN